MNKKLKVKLYAMFWTVGCSLFSIGGMITMLALFIWPIGLLMFYFNVIIIICAVGAMQSFIMIRRLISGNLTLEQRVKQLENVVNVNSDE